jgi:hypothetical protein
MDDNGEAARLQKTLGKSSRWEQRTYCAQRPSTVAEFCGIIGSLDAA